MSFDVSEFLDGLTVDPEDHDLDQCRKLAELTQHILEDPYLCRSYYWGVAAAMENQLTYLGGNYRVNLERRLNAIEGNGILSESDVRVKWFANEDKPHVNSDVTIEDQIDEIKTRIDQCNDKMRTAAIMFVVNVHNHDEVSRQLEQLSYASIKSRSAAKRKAAG